MRPSANSQPQNSRRTLVDSRLLVADELVAHPQLAPRGDISARKLVVTFAGAFEFQVGRSISWVDPSRLLFADAGRGYGYKEDFDFAKLRYSAGVELRIFLPVFQFPLRFIYAFNPAPEPGDDFEEFQFTIGNTF